MTSARRPLAGLATAALVAAALVALPEAGTAQNPYAEQVITYLDGVEERTLSEGYVPEGESEGWMMSGAEGATILRLPAGRFVVIGMSMPDCSNLDLAVYDAGGAMVSSDVLDDDVPIVNNFGRAPDPV